MEERDETAISRVPSHYMRHPVMDGSASGSQPGFHSLPEMRSFSNPLMTHSIDRATICGGGSAVSAMPVEIPSPSPSPLPPHAMNLVSRGGGVALGEPMKRKRGRPRKYCPDGTMSLDLIPSSSPDPGSVGGIPGMGSAGETGTPMSTEKRRRGRPPGTGRKQQLASYGEWISSSAGMGFTPHIITISDGEDISSKIMWFSQQGPRAICVVSATGAISTATLRQPASSGVTVTYEGHFEIVSLSGSYVLSANGRSCSRSGGLSVTLLGRDGRLLGGGVGGLLIASSPVQVFVASFIYRGTKPKNNPNLDATATNPGKEEEEGEELPFSDPKQTPPSSDAEELDGTDAQVSINLAGG
ncbi:unnamed protein product [Spirodela intermedia]|uniref:AT-hook motif nuclear-localized protein n=1 Tax=Spirodela intermedia TaxID=51605 RepID=A0A7I8JV62_SPIIN|nr:unnamed protein product [Spirodela intermedia]CAA6673352.1 unnamed protein product [Spirodela intermedia]